MSQPEKGESLAEIFDRAERGKPMAGPEPATLKKRHRMGLFFVAIGAILGIVGIFSDSYETTLDDHMRTIGGWLFLLGYPLVRMFYWARST